MYYNLNHLNNWLRDSIGFLYRASISRIIKPRRDPLDPSREHSDESPGAPWVAMTATSVSEPLMDIIEEKAFNPCHIPVAAIPKCLVILKGKCLQG